MTITTAEAPESPAEEAEEKKTPPPRGHQLRQWAKGRREESAVQALADEEQLLEHDDVWKALVWENGRKVTLCWDHFSSRLYTLGSLDEQDRAFLHLVLSMVCGHSTSLVRVMELDERRLGIILRAIVRLAGNDRIAVGTYG